VARAVHFDFLRNFTGNFQASQVQNTSCSAGALCVPQPAYLRTKETLYPNGVRGTKRKIALNCTRALYADVEYSDAISYNLYRASAANLRQRLTLGSDQIQSLRVCAMVVRESVLARLVYTDSRRRVPFNLTHSHNAFPFGRTLSALSQAFSSNLKKFRRWIITVDKTNAVSALPVRAP
jgi:hypothetical protein